MNVHENRFLTPYTSKEVQINKIGDRLFIARNDVLNFSDLVQGIESWPQFSDLSLPYTQTYTSQLLIDHPTNPQYFAKSKNMRTFMEFNSPNDYTRYAGSIIHELKVGTKISEILKRINLSRKFSYAFSTFAFIPLLGGVISKGRKFKIYPYVKHHGYSRDQRVINELNEVFLQEGIIPHDLKQKQILIALDDDRTLPPKAYLTDIELYTFVK